MIFVTVGSQKFQFNRLLKEIDRLIEIGIVNEEVFAQTGYSDYKPKNYEYKDFLDRDEFAEVISKCDKVITHGGTGAIIGAVKQGKKVIAVPRLAKYDEHVDDHQLQLIEQFEEQGFIKSIKSIEDIQEILINMDGLEVKRYISNTKEIIKMIDTLIKS